MENGKIEVQLELLIKLIEEAAPNGKEKTQALLKLDEAMMWLERVDWFEEPMWEEKGVDEYEEKI